MLNLHIPQPELPQGERLRAAVQAATKEAFQAAMTAASKAQALCAALAEATEGAERERWNTCAANWANSARAAMEHWRAL